jgi:hypothetical protein
MNKVYATMSGGMLITAAAAWAIANLSVTTDPTGATVALREGQYLTGPGRGDLRHAPALGDDVRAAGVPALRLGRPDAPWIGRDRQLGFFAFAAAMGCR